MRRFVLCSRGRRRAAAAGGRRPRRTCPPSLTVDTAFALTGVNDFNFRAGAARSTTRAARRPTRRSGRSYSVGRTETLAGDTDVAVVARRADGSLDPTFAGDGSLALPITAGNDDDGVAHRGAAGPLAAGARRRPTSARRRRRTSTSRSSALTARRHAGPRVRDRRSRPSTPARRPTTAGGVRGRCRAAARLAITGATTPGRARTRSWPCATRAGAAVGPVRVLDAAASRARRPRRRRRLARRPIAVVAIAIDDVPAGDRAARFSDDFGSGRRRPRDRVRGRLRRRPARACSAYGGMLWATGAVTTAATATRGSPRLDGAALADAALRHPRPGVRRRRQPVNTTAHEPHGRAGRARTRWWSAARRDRHAGQEWSFAAFNELERRARPICRWPSS